MSNFGGFPNPFGSRIKALTANFNSHGIFSAKALSGDSASSKSFGSNIRSAFQSFPLKAGLVSGGLALTGDTIAQVLQRSKKIKDVEKEAELLSPCCREKKLAEAPGLWSHDPIRALRMFSYGFLLYGPGSQVWYQFLDSTLPAKNFANFAIKVAANQVVLGPIVISVVFAWNFAWMKKLSLLQKKFSDDFWPTLQAGWKFWIPMAFINFGLVPLPARVAYMSCCSVFWNFYLSTTVGKEAPPALATIPAAN